MSEKRATQAEIFEAVELSLDAMRLVNMHGTAHKGCSKDCPILQGALMISKDAAERAVALMPPITPPKPKQRCPHCGEEI